MSLLAGLGGLALLWIGVNVKSSRPDGVKVKRVHPYRKVVYSINRNKAASQVCMDTHINAEPLLAYIKHYNESHQTHLTVHHCVIAAVNHALYSRPDMDRFVMGGRLYQRSQRSISFTVKKVKRNRKAALGTIKLPMHDNEPFDSLVARISTALNQERSETPTAVDREMSFLSAIPAPILRLGIRLGSWLNEHHWLPGAFLRSDVMHTSAFVANLGSVGMPSAYHHLYEWGTCPIFATVGQIEPAPMIEQDQVVVRQRLTMTFSFDERVADGLTAWETIRNGLQTLEHPTRYFTALTPTVHTPSGETS